MNADTVTWLIVAVLCGVCYPGARRFVRELKAAWTESKETLSCLRQARREGGLAGMVAAWRLMDATKRLDKVYSHIDREKTGHKVQLGWLEFELAQARQDFDRAVVARQAATREGGAR